MRFISLAYSLNRFYSSDRLMSCTGLQRLELVTAAHWFAWTSLTNALLQLNHCHGFRGPRYYTSHFYNNKPSIHPHRAQSSGNGSNHFNRARKDLIMTDGERVTPEYSTS
jgi:hypothetical protein